MKLTPGNHKKNQAIVGTSLIIISSFFYASYGIWTKLLGDFFDAYTASALRSLLVILFLIPIAMYYRQIEPLHFRKNWFYIVGMILGSLFTWGPLYFSILHAGVGISLAINYASIVIGMLFFGWLLSGEQFTIDKSISATLGILGLVLIFLPSISSLGWLSLSAAMVSGFATAINTVFAQKIPYASTQSTIVSWIASVIANTLLMFVFNKSFPSFHGQIQWLYLVIFAIVSIFASWSMVKGVKLIDAGTAGILGLLEIVFGVLFGMIFFHERPTLITLVGIAIVIGAAGIPYIKDFKNNR